MTYCWWTKSSVIDNDEISRKDPQSIHNPLTIPSIFFPDFITGWLSGFLASKRMRCHPRRWLDVRSCAQGPWDICSMPTTSWWPSVTRDWLCHRKNSSLESLSFFFFFRSIQLDWCRFFNIKVTQNTGVFRSCVFLASGMTFWRSIQSFPAFQRSYRMDRDQWTSCGFPAMMMWETTRLRDLLGLNLYMPWRKPCVVERPLVWELLLNKEMLCSWMSWTLKVVKWKQIGACGMQDVVPWNHISDSQLKSSLNDPTQRIYRKHVVIATPMEFVQQQVVALGFKPLRGFEVRPWGEKGRPDKKKPGWHPAADIVGSFRKRAAELVWVGASYCH